MIAGALALILAGAATPALAQEEAGAGAGDGAGSAPRFCPNRPSLGSSACITEPGRVQLEVSSIDWQRDDTPDSRDDRVSLGDFQARLGIAPATEVQIGWTPYGHDRQRDRLAGGIDRTSGVGDVRLAVRQNLRHPDGKGLSFGVEPFVTLPVGRTPIGGGDWGAGAVVPVTYDVGETLILGVTGEVDAAVDEDGDGRHLQGSGIVTLDIHLTDALTADVEAQMLRDQDPSGHATRVFAAAGLTHTLHGTRAVFVEGVAGLNHDSPDVRVLGGIAAVF